MPRHACLVVRDQNTSKPLGEVLSDQLAKIAGVGNMLTEGHLQDNAKFVELIQLLKFLRRTTCLPVIFFFEFTVSFY